MTPEEKKNLRDGAKEIARQLQLDLAAIMWRRMLEKNLTVAIVAKKSKHLSRSVVREVLHAKRNCTSDEIGGIALGLGIRLDFTARPLQ